MAPVAQDRPHGGDPGAPGREEQRAPVVGAPDEVAADRPADLEGVAWPAADGPLAFVCGPTSFVESVAGDLVALGYAPGRIKTERFGATGGR